MPFTEQKGERVKAFKQKIVEITKLSPYLHLSQSRLDRIHDSQITMLEHRLEIAICALKRNHGQICEKW